MMDRRQFVGVSLAGVSAVGGVGLLYSAKRSWDPLPSVEAAGFTIVDLSKTKENILEVVEWRGKPIFILKKPKNLKNERDVVVGDNRFLVVIANCTHLGCIPQYKQMDKKFFCACHGGEFDINGRETFGPPPRPLVIPPFSINNLAINIGEEGPEYKELVKKKLIS